MNIANDEKLKIALEALRIIALSYRQRIDHLDTPPYVFAQQTLERLGEDLEKIPSWVK